MQTKVLLVDDHALLRKGLQMLLDDEPDLQVVGEAEDGERAVQLAGELTPNVVIMDITMPGLNGIEATRQILAAQPDTRILALSIHRDKQFVDDMLAAGAAGYLLKESVPEELIEGIRTVRRGKVYLSAAITEVVVFGYRELMGSEGVTDSSRKKAGTGPLLKTKLYCPSLSPGLVQRPRLVTFLDQNFQRPLTLITAPAGYGKSVLASSWVQASDHPFAWIALDENDNDLHTFLAYLVAAIQKPFPEALPDTALLLNTVSLPAVPVLARTLVNELDRIPERVILVLDDYHQINEVAIHEFLAEILRHPLENLHLLLLTRTDPPFDLLTLQARQQMDALRAQALSFTKDETAAFLQEKMGMAVDEGVVKALTEKTEGWITGLILMTLSVQDSARLVNLSTTLPGESQTLDFLAAEALAHQPRDIQTSLLKTSILNRFCAPLCEVICTSAENQDTLISDGDGFIRWLTDSNLFVIPLDERGQWFRYHHLFQELLQRQLESVLEADEIAELHTRASRWFAKNGLIDEAIQYALSAGDPIAAANIIEQNRYAMLNEDKWYVLDKWLALLPEDVKRQRPNLLLAQVEVSLNQQNLATVLARLDMAEQALGQEPLDHPLWGEINFYRGYLCYFQSQGKAANEHQVLALDLLPKSAQFYKSEAELHYALSLHMIGEKQRAIKALKDGLRERRNSSNIHNTRYWAGLSFIHLLEGELSEVLYPAVQYQTIGSSYDNKYVEGWALYLQAFVHIMQLTQQKSIQEFSWIFERRYNMQTRIALESVCGMVLLFQNMGQPEKAVESCREAHIFAQETNDPVIALIASSLQARLSLMQNDIETAVRWLQTADLTIDEGIMLWWIELPRLTACRVLIAEGSPESLQAAIAKLKVYQKENQGVYNTYQVIVIMSLLALAYDKQNKNEQALDVLEETLVLAKPGRWIWPFIELGSPMEKLLKQLKLHGVPSELGNDLDLILAACPSTPKVPVQRLESDLIDPLTEREMQVMRLLVSTLSAGEIAEELVITVNTMRVHIKNIYSKLEVHSRVEAIQRARELGLI